MTQASAPTINATERNNARHASLTIPRRQNAGTTPLEIDWEISGLLISKQRWDRVKKPVTNEKFTDELIKKEYD